MGKTVAKKETAVQAFDFELEVVETKALYDRWKGIALTWRSATVDLGRKLWRVHQELGGEGPGKYQSKVPTGTIKVPTGTLKDFYEAVGMPKRTFYNFIKRIKDSIEEGVDIMALPGDMKLIEAATKKSQREVELEELVAEQKVGIESRERTLVEFEKDIKKEQKEVEDAYDIIADLKKKAKAQTKPDPTLLKEIEELEKRQVALAKEVDWYNTASSFKQEMTVLLDHLHMVERVGKKIVSSKKPK